MRTAWNFTLRAVLCILYAQQVADISEGSSKLFVNICFLPTTCLNFMLFDNPKWHIAGLKAPPCAKANNKDARPEIYFILI